MGTIKMITAVPRDLAEILKQKRKLTDFNTLPQMHPALLAVIKEYFEKTIGYSNSPIACLSKVSSKSATIQSVGGNIKNYIPLRANDSIVFELQMPEDCIVSVEYTELLKFTELIASVIRPDEFSSLDSLSQDTFEMVEGFNYSLTPGIGDNLVDAITFIPCLELEKCNFFAVLNSAFETSNFEIPGIPKVVLHELQTFM